MTSKPEGVWFKVCGFFVWASGRDVPDSPAPHPDAEAYCTAETLAARYRSLPSHDPAEDRALAKIGARYGVEF